jgi:hypothetical protein
MTTKRKARDEKQSTMFSAWAQSSTTAPTEPTPESNKPEVSVVENAQPATPQIEWRLIASIIEDEAQFKNVDFLAGDDFEDFLCSYMFDKMRRMRDEDETVNKETVTAAFGGSVLADAQAILDTPRDPDCILADAIIIKQRSVLRQLEWLLDFSGRNPASEKWLADARYWATAACTHNEYDWGLIDRETANARLEANEEPSDEICKRYYEWCRKNREEHG